MGLMQSWDTFYLPLAKMHLHPPAPRARCEALAFRAPAPVVKKKPKGTKTAAGEATLDTLAGREVISGSGIRVSRPAAAQRGCLARTGGARPTVLDPGTTAPQE